MTADGAPGHSAVTCVRLARRSLRAGVANTCAAVMIGSAAPASGQTSDDVQVWISAVTSGAVHQAWRAHSELQARWADDARHYQRTVLRLMGGREMAPGVTAWFGFEQTWPAAGRAPEERRLWQQVIIVRPAGIWSLSHRGRLEERFIAGADRMVPRVRYSLRATRPVFRQGIWGLVVGAEVFFQLRDARLSEQLYPAGFDRTRLTTGVSRQLSHGITIEPAYAWQFINSPDGVADRREHLLQLQVMHRF